MFEQNLYTKVRFILLIYHVYLFLCSSTVIEYQSGIELSSPN
ncbi:hypothetical protein HMPREF9555_01115 [Selenomonas artemidis F0399]|uniref:Uncharacterized protein n=1 Tax=Selenomonas artemidis F0399 TaxID=749551 RepID=E7N2A4_9FIRM|nr:hypothetical protein HMPREF9555_01115 [Selenomonas artemidis F0399]